MNASQMRVKANLNSHKAAEKMKFAVIQKANEEIQAKAAQVFLNAGIQILNNPLWKQYNLTEAVCLYYIDRGFKVSKISFIGAIHLTISWDDEDENNE
ncbi:hypothetical protein NDK25_21865 [Niallia taxi]|nr:hypothetical protein [Niallia taxi]MDE5054864.1 hypothetical protein [Niallia taxi]